MISTRPHRYNPQLHVYLALLILHGSVSDAPDTSTQYAFLSSVDPAAVRAAQQHFTNAVQLAGRFKSIHQSNLQMRLRNAKQRASRELHQNKAYQRAVQRLMQEDAWVLQEDSEEEQGAESESSAPDSSSSSESSSSSSSDSDNDTDMDIETALEAGFGSDPDEPPHDQEPVQGPAPAPPPTAGSPSAESLHDSPHNESPAPSEKAAAQPDTPNFLFPANDWAAEVARLYLDMVRIRLQLGGTKRAGRRK